MTVEGLPDTAISDSEPAPAPSATVPSGILRGVTALAGGEIVARAVAFVATALLARRLGPAGFGVVGFATAVCGYLLLAINSGLHDVGTREVARAPDRAVEVFSSVATIRLVLSVGAFAVLAVGVSFLPKPATTKIVVLLSGLSFFSFALDPSWVFKGLERPVLAGFGLVLAQLIYALGVIAVIHGPGDVAFVPVAQFAGELGAALLLCGFLLRGVWPTLALADGWRILRSAGYLGLARIFRTIVITFDVVMLGFLATDRDVGLYSAAYRFTFLLMAIAASIAAAYLPSYARIASGATASLRRLVETSLAIAVTIGAPLVAGAIVTARPLLALLFGPDYVDATTAFRLLMLSVGIVFLHWCLSNLLIVAHRTRLQATIHGTAAAVNIGLNFVLIPRFGIAGAAAATLVAEITIAIAGVVVLMQMDVLPRLRPFLGPLVATLAMSGAVWWAANYVPLVGRFVLGGVVYVAVLGAIGGVPRGRSW